MEQFKYLLIAIVAALGCLWLSGCARQAPVVVVYTALDQNFSEPIFRQFEEATGIRVRPKYDTESTKTIGLVNTLIAEKDRPRCDVFWNNEIVNTIRLKQRGLLQSYRPRHAMEYPAWLRDPAGFWHGFAGRARVLLVNTNALREADFPGNLLDLADPSLKGQAGMAKPLFGTTATHVACLFSEKGAAVTQAWLQKIRENDVSIQSGNKSCAVSVSNGDLAVGLTDTDDAIIEVRRGAPVRMVFADAADGGSGVLLIPNTLGLIKDGPHPDAGRRLIDFLLSPEVEHRLAQSESAQIPLHRGYRGPHPLGHLPERWMEVDFEAAADAFETAAQWLREEFLTP